MRALGELPLEPLRWPSAVKKSRRPRGSNGARNSRFAQIERRQLRGVLRPHRPDHRTSGLAVGREALEDPLRVERLAAGTSGR